MKYLLTALIPGILTAVAVYLYLQDIQQKADIEREHQEILRAEQMVEKKLQEINSEISSRLSSFTKSIAEDRNFTLRLLVENDRSSPDITQSAARFLGPMGFSVLDLTDSSFVILSSGHFPANAGNSIANKASSLDKQPGVYRENLIGNEVLTMQALSRFEIAEFPFFAAGGLKLDEEFLRKLSPSSDITVLLKDDNKYIGDIDVRSISEIKDNRILINDNEFLASQISLPSSGENNPVLIIVLRDRSKVKP